MKNCKTQILIAVLITGVLTYFLTKQFSPEYEVVNKTSDTTTTTKVAIEEMGNTFSAEQVGNIKKVLIDSLSAVHRATIKGLMNDGKWNMEYAEEEDSTDKKEYAYVSEMDTVFVAVDKNDEVSDSIKVTSTFISPEPLPENSIHLLAINHKSFNKTVTNETTITNTATVKEEKTFWERFHIAPNASAGVGLINRQFDIYIGVGVNYEL